MQAQLKTPTPQQPAGDLVTLRFAAGAVFGVFRVGRGRYRVAMLEPGRPEGWLDCEAPDEADFRSLAEAKAALGEHIQMWARLLAEGYF